MDDVKIEQLLPFLQKEYSSSGGWEHLRSDASSWLHIAGIVMGGDGPRPPGFPPDMSRQGPLSTPNPLYELRHNPPKHSPPLPILLLDADRRPILGMRGPRDAEKFKAVVVDGQTVGWVGLHSPPPFFSGPPASLLQRQTKHLFILGFIVVLITAVIALAFSKYLLRPIQQLINGTCELAQRNFSVRIASTNGDELGQLADNFNTMAQTLGKYEKMRQQWLTDISHEMRTPLAILCGEIEALQDDVRKPTPDNLASLHAEVERISKLVEDLHLLSKADSDSLVLDMQRIAPYRILEELTDCYRHRLAQCGIDLELMTGDVQTAFIKGDPHRLGQVFGNLLDNVCKYTEAPGKLRIFGHCDTGGLSLYFQDSGPGVPDESMPHLFDRLYRVEPSRNRDTGGSGLGLAICQQIVENHNGLIWADHSPIGGLSIGIRLPLI